MREPVIQLPETRQWSPEVFDRHDLEVKLPASNGELLAVGRPGEAEDALRVKVSQPPWCAARKRLPPDVRGITLVLRVSEVATISRPADDFAEDQIIRFRRDIERLDRWWKPRGTVIRCR